MDTAKPSSVRVLIRPPHSPATTASAPSQTSLTPPVPFSDRPSSSSSSAAASPFSSVATTSKSKTRSSAGVVVVGFIGRRPNYCSQIINRVIDSNVFGWGNLDKNLCIEKEQVMDWFKRRKISYYHDDEKGILFLQLCSTRCPAMAGFSEPSPGFDSVVEEHDFWDLQGTLFMFSVCHVIIYIQEGSHLDPQFLKNFRVLQAAKHALAPFVKSLITPHLSSKPRSSSSARPSSSATSSNNASPGRAGSARGRNASAISLMSGLGSYASLFPGQCTPVTLFVFIDDFVDSSNLATNTEDVGDVSSSNHSSNPSSVSKSNMPPRGSGSVVVLARGRSEGGFRKKLQSSLEAKIRFLTKKCLMSGSDVSQFGPRNRGGSPSAPLFSLDASRAVVLLDRSSVQKGESLEHATGLLEDILNGKATSDSLLLESHGQGARKEDIISVKDFISRQSDILRGKGGVVNSNSGSAAGVGMVAVAAAAAAAASVASSKMFTSPDLPNMEVWLSSGCLILQGILSAKSEGIDESEFIKRRPRSRNFSTAAVDGSSSKGDPLEIAAFWLRSGRGLNLKFSTSWCERALPAAKEIYLKDLPACYPTSQHEINLEKAVHTFYSMVKGPAVPLYVKKLEDECTSIWRSGRQLCDATSLTGKPCMHQRHLMEGGDPDLDVTAKPHSSDFFFLHACACGCSRQLRPDPFDFESANSNFISFQDCDKLLPSLKLPEISIAGPIQPSSWSLLRLGSSEYYDPSKGLLQSGFCGNQKFLPRWFIYLDNYKDTNDLAMNMVHQGSEIRQSDGEFSAVKNMKSTVTEQPSTRVLVNGEKGQKIYSDKQNSDDKKINFGRGLPNFRLKKPFSEVVAGSASSDSAFPPLQHLKASSLVSDKTAKHSKARDKSIGQAPVPIDDQIPQKSEDVSFGKGSASDSSDNSRRDSDSFLQIGSNVVPVNLNVAMIKSPSLNVTAYVGFEHECPYGHRFLLNSEHLHELGPPYASLEETQLSSTVDNLDYVSENFKVNKNARHGKVHRNSNGMIATHMNKERNMSRGIIDDGNSYNDELSSKQPSLGKDLRGNLQSRAINDDEGYTFSMLNRNLPIYMNCPHCRLSKNKRDQSNVNYAGTISQLQRIIMVTPPLPVVLATCPVVHFEPTCLPPSVPDRERKLQFSLGCQVILPPESFLTLRLPFVYGVQLEDNSLHSLSPFEHRPEMTAWIAKGTSFQILSKGDQSCSYEAQ